MAVPSSGLSSFMPSALQMLLLNDSGNTFLLGASSGSIFKRVVKQKGALNSKGVRANPAPQ